MMKIKIIQSKDNYKLKLVRKLRLKKHRYKERKFVIESRKLVEEAIKSSLNIDYLIVRDDISEKELERINLERGEVYFLEKGLFNPLSQMKNPDGYLAVVSFNDNRPSLADRVLLLDRLNDPGNLGTIIRSADAFGYRDIYLYKSVDPYNEKTLRASMGSSFRVNIIEIGLEDIKKLADTYDFFLADMGGRDYRMVQYPEKICLVIGNEANGIGKELRAIGKKTISIPMSGQIESLNAAISASILMAGIGEKF